MSPAVLKCLVGVGAVAGGGVGAVYLGGGFKGLFKSKEELEIEKLKDYGIPDRCVKDKKINQCNLSGDDLSKIKFHGFPEGGETVVTKLWVGVWSKGWYRKQAITLTFKDGKYIFENYFEGPRNHQLVHRPIKITRGNSSVTLDGNMDSEFTVVDGALRKEEVNDLGLPKRCEIGDEQSKTCELSENDIKRLKLKETGVSPDILYGKKDGSKKINLKIEKTAETDYKDGKKYILTTVDPYALFYSTDELKDTGRQKTEATKVLYIDKSVGKTFKNEGNSLELVKAN